MSCQIRDYQGAPLKLTALFHFLLPYQLFAKPVREMERLPRVSERGQKRGLIRVRGGGGVLEQGNYKETGGEKCSDSKRSQSKKEGRIADN